MKKRWMVLTCAGALMVGAGSGGAADAPYPVLPDVLRGVDGAPVRDAADWHARRRPELLEIFAREVYGRTPAGRPEGMRFEVTSLDRAALGGRATRKEVTLWLGAGEDGQPRRLRVLLYVPNGARGPSPVFLGLNFAGNASVHADPGIAADAGFASEKRGAEASKWQIEAVLARGYATATAWCDDLRLDAKDRAAERPGDAWGEIGLWAWGLSRALDYLETDADVDARRVALHGFSRLGKAALWAGAQDERFALVISNASGCGGAQLSRGSAKETIAQITKRFPFWFAGNFSAYGGREAELPVDQHALLALIAPRPLHVGSGERDQYCDARGEYRAVLGAAPVYALFGLKGPEQAQADLPPLETVVGGALAYHVRPGRHDMTAYDWACYLDFADREFRADANPPRQ